jgi:hypothetical protein
MVGVVKPRGPHHFASSSGSVHALNTVEAGARKTRFIRSASSLGRTVITRLLVDAVARSSFAPPEPGQDCLLREALPGGSSIGR